MSSAAAPKPDIAPPKATLTLRPSSRLPATRDQSHNHPDPLVATHTHTHPLASPSASASESTANASLTFIGTATTLLSWNGVRILTDPNFLHAGDHVHLGPGVQATRLTNPAVELDALPDVDLVLLSHYHGDHFDQEVEARLHRALPIVTTPHARAELVDKKEEGEKFEQVTALDFWESILCVVDEAGESTAGSERTPAIRIAGMPGKHVPPGPLSIANDLLKAVPPTNGWMLELGSVSSRTAGDDLATRNATFASGYRIYISGDTLLVPELNEIPQRYAGLGIDLMLVHLGGTTIPGPSLPLLMVTMDAEQGVQLVRLMQPEVVVPIHYDDYDVFLSPLEDFKRRMREEGFEGKAVYLERGEALAFTVR